MRLLVPGENILELSKEFEQNKIKADLYAFPELLYRSKEEQKINEFNEKFFKSKKWERVGDLLKGTEESLEPNADKKHAFTKKTFYLGNDNLYYVSKDSTYSFYLLETHKVNVLPLKAMKLRMDKDSKNHPIIIVICPAEVLVLKASKEVDHFKWYSAIHSAVSYARAERRKEEIEKSLRELEREITELDRRSLAFTLKGIEGVLAVEDGRKILFDALASQEAEYKYLGCLYGLISEYKKNCRYRKEAEAMSNAKLIRGLLKECGNVPKEEIEFLGDVEFGGNVKEIAKQMYSPSLTLALDRFIYGEDSKEVDGGLFKELEEKLVLRFKEGCEKFSRRRKFNEELEMLLAIPAMYLKRNIKLHPRFEFASKLTETQQFTESFLAKRQFYSKSVIDINALTTFDPFDSLPTSPVKLKHS
eukprot:TRINITY_DN6309_c0_g1_i1.p1 TRINITY_DN6309_c0_g1~~TRINITY_DN6309_c0_g1_i1.p1  ORF type:complete len:418 (+),score=130.51 TRINITY_DN6309_c0_g1_i1:275-1528(+)